MPGHPVPPAQPAEPAPTGPHADPYAGAPRRSAGGAVHPSVRSAHRRHEDPAGDVVRWAVFSCLLVPVVLVVYGTSFGGAAVATLGLVAVTAVCRVMLRRSEQAGRAAALAPARERAAAGRRRRHSRGAGPARGGGRHGCAGSGGGTPRD
ncbi:hypothetical protein SUDANB120_02286 [Streptomyces sp. enrichment culture]|uniref:hypothetical protein n=1 Tax=Streptomyces TaxID=1883 RepID=UPI00199DFCA2|nr:hypothetical protein GCM10010286_12860 [Streptomyces toxytricini]